MKTYKLFRIPLTGEISPYAKEFIDGVHTGANVNINTNKEYLAWIDEGNTPELPEGAE